MEGSPLRVSYESNGFVLTPEPVLPTTLIEQAVAGMDEIRTGIYNTGIAPQPSPWNPGDDPRRLCKIEMPQIANRSIFELVSHPAIGRLAAEATGANTIQVWWVQLLYKPPGGPEAAIKTAIGWHQDRQYWGAWEEDSELLTAWVALSNVTEETGPMRFLRGSHRWGLLDQGDFFGQDHEAQRKTISLPEGNLWEETAALLRPGGVSLHHCLTFHGSSSNFSSAPRRSLAIHLRTEKARPKGGIRHGLTAFIDNHLYCPVIHG